jgi:hypothetical protein
MCRWRHRHCQKPRDEGSPAQRNPQPGKKRHRIALRFKDPYRRRTKSAKARLSNLDLEKIGPVKTKQTLLGVKNTSLSVRTRCTSSVFVIFEGVIRDRSPVLPRKRIQTGGAVRNNEAD